VYAYVFAAFADWFFEKLKWKSIPIIIIIFLVLFILVFGFYSLMGNVVGGARPFSIFSALDCGYTITIESFGKIIEQAACVT
jgi:hypothetical protein